MEIEPRGTNRHPYRVVITWDDGVKSTASLNSIEAVIVKGAKFLRENRSAGRRVTIALFAAEKVPDTDPDSSAASRYAYTTLAEGITDDILAEADDTWVRSPRPDQHALRAALAAAGVAV